MSESTLAYQERYLVAWGTPLCKATTKTETCDATILGSIMKGFRSLGLVPDFDKFILKSIKDMEEGIKKLRIEFLESQGSAGYSGNCNGCRYGGSYSHNCRPQPVYHSSTCSFLPELHEKINKATEGIKGLNLDDFKSSKTKGAGANVGKWDLFEYK